MDENRVPQLVDHEPIFKRGDLAVWCAAHIPIGVVRYALAYNIGAALDHARSPALSFVQTSLFGMGSCMAAVWWAFLQPRNPVPRGPHAMSPEQWGRNRDKMGICEVCLADDSMWCDEVVHQQAAERLTAEGLAKAYSSTLIADPTKRLAEISKRRSQLKHGPGGSGFKGPCDATCEKCALDAEERKLLRIDNQPPIEHRIGNPPPIEQRNKASSGVYEDMTRSVVRADDHVLMERGRIRVLVDLEFEPWE